jgi:hypothetical protein
VLLKKLSDWTSPYSLPNRFQTSPCKVYTNSSRIEKLLTKNTV